MPLSSPPAYMGNLLVRYLIPKAASRHGTGDGGLALRLYHGPGRVPVHRRAAFCNHPAPTMAGRGQRTQARRTTGSARHRS